MADKTSQTDQIATASGAIERRPLLTATQAAERLGVPPSLLEHLRGTGEGPAYIKLSGKYVRYRQEDLDAFIDARRCQSTAQA